MIFAVGWRNHGSFRHKVISSSVNILCRTRSVLTGIPTQSVGTSKPFSFPRSAWECMPRRSASIYLNTISGSVINFTTSSTEMTYCIILLFLIQFIILIITALHTRQYLLLSHRDSYFLKFNKGHFMKAKTFFFYWQPPQTR